MTAILYAHPFSSYCQKVLVALYENATPFEYRTIAPENPEFVKELEKLRPLQRFPVLVDGGQTVLESSTIIEHLDLHYPGSVKLVPDDRRAALKIRMMDRVYDNYVMTPMQKIVHDAMRPPENRDPFGVAEARKLLDRIYAWLDAQMAGQDWAAGSEFSLADCAAAPALFYADWAHHIDAAHAHLRTYRARLLARPSFARAVDEARPFRAYFPLGAPDRD